MASSISKSVYRHDLTDCKIPARLLMWWCYPPTFGGVKKAINNFK